MRATQFGYIAGSAVQCDIVSFVSNVLVVSLRDMDEKRHLTVTTNTMEDPSKTGHKHTVGSSVTTQGSRAIKRF